MGGLVDAARQSRDDDKSGIAEIVRQLAREFEPGARGVARTDDRNHRPLHDAKLAAHPEQWRWIVQHRKTRRITAFTRSDQANAQSLGCRKLRARVLFAADPLMSQGAAAARQFRQPSKRRARAAEMIDERAE